MKKPPKNAVKGKNIRIEQVRRTARGGTNNLSCGCGGTLVRQGNGTLKCNRCPNGRVETPL